MSGSGLLTTRTVTVVQSHASARVLKGYTGTMHGPHRGVQATKQRDHSPRGAVMNILVTGGTGTIGSQVVRELLTRGAQVQVLTRDPAKAGKLPAGVKAVTGDLSKVETVKRVFDGVDSVFLLNPVSQTEASEALFSPSPGMRAAKVTRVVYLSVHDADKAAGGCRTSDRKARRGGGR